MLAGKCRLPFHPNAQPGTPREDGHDARHNANDDLAGLVRDVANAASAYICGDVDTYFSLIRHGADYTLMSPFGGEPLRGSRDSPEQREVTASFFHAGEATLDVVASHMSGDLAVLVVVERQHGEVDDLPDQDWSLRVTLVFRREGNEWLLIHRHADPLTHEISFEQLATLARGSHSGSSESGGTD